MKKLFAVSLAALLGLVLSLGQSVAAGSFGKPSRATARPARTAPAGQMASVTGPVKGAPSGKTFVIGRRGGDVTVTLTRRARVRTTSGKFASFADIQPGTMVTAKGTMSYTTLMATEVQVHPRGRRAGAGAKAPTRTRSPRR